MCKGKQGQCLALQFHPHGRCRQYVDEQRVVKQRGQIVVGVHLAAFLHRRQVAQQVCILAQCGALLRETVCQRVGKLVVAFGQRKGLFAYRYLVETVRIEPLPGQFQQSQRLKGVVQRLSFGQSSHVVQSGVKLPISATIALQTASRHVLALEHHHAATLLCQLACTDKATQTAANDYYVVHPYDFWFE